MLPLLGLIAGILMFMLPGFLLLDYIKFRSANKILFGIVLSFGITGFLFYSISFAMPVNHIMIAVYSLILLYLAYLKRNSFREEISGLFRASILKNAFDKALLFLLFFIFIILGIYIAATPVHAFDDFVYHVPLINDFSQDGKFERYSQPKIDLELRANRYPLLFETILGVAKFSSGVEYWRILPVIFLVLAAYLIFLISKELGHANLLGPFLFVSSLHVFQNSTTYSLDIFMSLVLLTAIYFLILNLKNNNNANLFFAGFFMGLGILTKLTGIIFFALIIIFLIIKKNKMQSVIKMAFAVFLTISIYATAQVAYYGVDANMGVGAWSTIAGDFFGTFTRNFSEIFVVLFDFIVIFEFSIIALVFFALSMAKNRKEDISFLNQLALFLLLGLIFAFSLTQYLPSYSDIPRFLFPVYALICTSAGFFTAILGNEKIRKILEIAVIIIAITALYETACLQMQYAGGIIYGKTDAGYSSLLPNESGTKIFFPTSSALVLGLEETELADITTYKKIDLGVCDFLKKEKINYVVIHWIGNWEYELRKFGSPNFDFVKELVEEVDTGECTKIIKGDKSSKFVVLEIEDVN